jgi:hypothetical protein
MRQPVKLMHRPPSADVEGGATDRVFVGAARPDIRQVVIGLVEVVVQEPVEIRNAGGGRAAKACSAVDVGRLAVLQTPRNVAHRPRQRRTQTVLVKVHSLHTAITGSKLASLKPLWWEARICTASGRGVLAVMFVGVLMQPGWWHCRLAWTS